MLVRRCTCSKRDDEVLGMIDVTMNMMVGT